MPSSRAAIEVFLMFLAGFAVGAALVFLLKTFPYTGPWEEMGRADLIGVLPVEEPGGLTLLLSVRNSGDTTIPGALNPASWDVVIKTSRGEFTYSQCISSVFDDGDSSFDPGDVWHISVSLRDGSPDCSPPFGSGEGFSVIVYGPGGLRAFKECRAPRG